MLSTVYANCKYQKVPVADNAKVPLSLTMVISPDHITVVYICTWHVYAVYGEIGSTFNDRWERQTFEAMRAGGNTVARSH